MAKKIIRPYFIPYFFTLVVFTLLTALLSILFFINREKKSVLENQHKQLEIIGISLDQEWNTLVSTTSWIAGNTQFTPGTLSRNPVEIKNAINDLNMYTIINGFIDHIIIFYRDLPFVITSDSTHRLGTLGSVYGNDLPEDSDFSHLANKDEAFLLPSQRENYFYIRHTLPLNSAHPYGVILYRIKRETLMGKLVNTFSYSYNGDIILNDNRGKEILALSEERLEESWNYSETWFFEKFPLSLTSQFPGKILFKNILPYFAAQLLSFLILMIAGSIIIYFFSVKNSRPLFSLKKAIEESLGRELPPVEGDLTNIRSGINELNSLVFHSHEAMKEKIILNILYGMYESREDLVLAGKPYGLNEWYDLTGIVAINIVSPGQFKDKTEIINYLDRCSEEGLIIRGINRTREEDLLLIITCKEEIRFSIVAKLKKCCLEIEKSYDCLIFCGVGPINESPRLLPFSFSEANSIMERGLFSSETPVLTKEDLLKTMEKDRGWADFTRRVTRELNLAMLSGTEIDVRNRTEALTDELRNIQIGILHVRLIMENILMNMRTFLEESGVRSALTNENYINQSFKSISAFGQFLLELCLDGQREFGKKRSASGYELRKHLLDYVDENYNHPNLTIESMADHFFYNPPVSE
jgi:two-component system response regulator YesN